MKRVLSLILAIGLFLPMCLMTKNVSAQKQSDVDTLKTQVSTIKDKISGVEERLATAEGDLSKLTKIKLSGYIQAQYLRYENPSTYPYNTFMLRRVRIKFTYEPINGVAFVLQPDFQPGNITLKDAYAVANEPWLKTFSLWAGRFNRPNYEVEYSSSNREVPERSRVIRALYPDEREIGFKLEVHPTKVPLLFQLAMLNGNTGMTINDNTGVNINPNPNSDFDRFKDIMARLTYRFKLGNIGALSIGAHGYFGKIKANDTLSLKGDYTKDKTVKIGDGMNRTWFGAEAQLYFDFLGGMAIKGEYLMGTNVTPGFYGANVKTTTSTNSLKNDTLFLTNTTTNTLVSRPAISKPFMGYYVYLVKNIGKKIQIAARYDYYDPNTKLGSSETGVNAYTVKGSSSTTNTYSGTGTVIASTNTTTTNDYKFGSGTSDVAYGTLTLALSYYFDDNIKFMLGYEMPFNQKVGTHIDSKGNTVGNVTQGYSVNGSDPKQTLLDYSTVFPQNTLTFRVQVKF